MEYPKEYANVMITYEGIVHVPDKYYGRDEKTIVTRRAFYCKSDGYYDRKDNFIPTPDGYFSVPQFWEYFTFSNGEKALLPYTFYQYPRVLMKDIIKWEYDKS